MAKAHLPTEMFKGVTAEQADEIEARVARIAGEIGVDLAAIDAARASEEAGTLTLEESHAFNVFFAVLQRWRFEHATPAMVQLNDDNFEAIALDPEGEMLVQFSTSWCGPCHRAAPILNEVAERGAKVGKVDCDDAVKTAKRFAIDRYPTFVYYKRGCLYGTFNGERTVANIENFLAEFK